MISSFSDARRDPSSETLVRNIRVVMMAFEQPELSPRELATRFTDTNSYYVSESSVYRLNRRALPTRRHAESMYYSWSKEFLEADKRRLAGDTARAATTDEVKQLRLKKSMIGDGGDQT